MTHLLTRAKAYVALVGATASALLATVGPDSSLGHVLVVVTVLATAFLTYRVPNADQPPRKVSATVDGLTHECHNPDCHVPGFAATLHRRRATGR